MVVTRKNQYGYVGSVKRPSTLIKVDGITVARVAESQHQPGYYFADFSFNGGKTYSWVWGISENKAELIQAVEKEAVRIVKQKRREACR